MEDIRARARELYVFSMITHPQLAKSLSVEFARPIDFETTKKWAQKEDWTGQRQQHFSVVANDGERIQIMKDIVYYAMLDAPTPTEMQKLTTAYAALIKVVIPPDRGGGKRPNDLLKK